MRRVRYLIVRCVVGYRAVSSCGPRSSRCEGAGAAHCGWSYIRNASGRCDTVASLETRLRSLASPERNKTTVARRAVANSPAKHDPSFCNYPVTHARPGCRASFHSPGHVQRFESRYSPNGCVHESRLRVLPLKIILRCATAIEPNKK